MGQHPTTQAPFISKQVHAGQYYFLNLDPDRKAPMTVVCGGREPCQPDYCVDRPTFQYDSIEYVSEGEGQLTLNGQDYPLHPGMVFWYGPGIPHAIRTSRAHPMVKYFVDFVGTRVRGLIEASPLARLEPLCMADPIRVYEIYENLQHSGSTGATISERICALLVEVLILRISEDTVPYRLARSQAWGTYLQCRRFIQSNFLAISNLEQAANDCQVDPAYLSRLFKRFARETPYRLLERMKMHRAAELLTHSNLLVKEVARQVGYPDPHHFCKVFRKTHGMSPTVFAKAGCLASRDQAQNGEMYA